jgi:hypothetical protein
MIQDITELSFKSELEVIQYLTKLEYRAKFITLTVFRKDIKRLYTQSHNDPHIYIFEVEKDDNKKVSLKYWGGCRDDPKNPYDFKVKFD